MEMQVANLNSTNGELATSKPPIPKTNVEPVTSFASLLDVAGSCFKPVTKISSTWLTTEANSSSSRPDVKTFIDATGTSLNVATQLLHGVVGSNTDLRDWSAIMSSKEPVAAARAATYALYAGTDNAINLAGNYMDGNDTIAKSGNFAIRLEFDQNQNFNEGNLRQNIRDAGLKLVDGKGLILRDAGINAEDIAKNAWLFGFDVNSVSKLQSHAEKLFPLLASAIQDAPSVKISTLGELVNFSTTSHLSNISSNGENKPDSGSIKQLDAFFASGSAIQDVSSVKISTLGELVNFSTTSHLSNISSNGENKPDSGSIKQLDAFFASGVAESLNKFENKNNELVANKFLLVQQYSEHANIDVSSEITINSNSKNIFLDKEQKALASLNNILNNSDDNNDFNQLSGLNITTVKDVVVNSKLNLLDTDQFIVQKNNPIKTATQMVAQKNMSSLDRILSIAN